MSPQRPATLHLALCAALTLAACNGASRPAADVAPAKAAITIDESQLPSTMRFAIDDLDTTKNACEDFDGYVNAKWLAANPIPADRSSWGPFEMLAERSLAVQHQLAEQAAADANATGIEKIVGDFWATGMDEAKIDAQGIAPLEADLAQIDALTDPAGIADYLRASARRGRQHPVRLRPRGRLQELVDEHRLRHPGRPGPARQGLLLRRGQGRDMLEAYEAHIAKVLELAGAAPGCRGRAGRGR